MAYLNVLAQLPVIQDVAVAMQQFVLSPVLDLIIPLHPPRIPLGF
jgi:hypothetical protein